MKTQADRSSSAWIRLSRERLATHYPLTTTSLRLLRLICPAHSSLSPGLSPSLALVRELSLFCAHPALYYVLLCFVALSFGVWFAHVVSHAHPGGSLSSFIRVNDEGRHRWFAKICPQQGERGRGVFAEDSEPSNSRHNCPARCSSSEYFTPDISWPHPAVLIWPSRQVEYSAEFSQLEESSSRAEYSQNVEYNNPAVD